MIVVGSTTVFRAIVAVIVRIIARTSAGCAELTHSLLPLAPRWSIVLKSRVHDIRNAGAGVGTVTQTVTLGIAADTMVGVATESVRSSRG